MKKLLLPFAFCALAGPALAHPHIFIDTGFRMEFDEKGQLTAVHVTWVYDDFYSLVMIEDLELDVDGDSAVSKAEEAALVGFDMNWMEGFDGDLQVFHGGQRIALSGPVEPTATIENGQIVTTHRRKVLSPSETGGAGNWEFRPFDPTFYTLYEIHQPAKVAGPPGCEAKVVAPDIEAGLITVRAELYALDEAEFPDAETTERLSTALASRVIVACPVS